VDLNAQLNRTQNRSTFPIWVDFRAQQGYVTIKKQQRPAKNTTINAYKAREDLPAAPSKTKTCYSGEYAIMNTET
jgi:hypothetical protein